jgi:hypothetical protein
VQAARARGGAAASKLRALQGRRPRLDQPQALARYCSGIILDVADHRLDVDTGRCVLYGLGIMRQLLEVANLDARLAALEAQLSTGKGKAWG